MGTLPELPSLHNHRLNHNPSKLPSYRPADLAPGPLSLIAAPARVLEHAPHEGEPAHTRNNATARSPTDENITARHTRNRSATTFATSASSSRPSLPPARPLTFPGVSSLPLTSPLDDPSPPSSHPFGTNNTGAKSKARGVPASHSRNGLRDSWKGPPPAMLTQRHTDNTTNWVAEQSTIPPPISIPPATVEKSPTDTSQPQPSKPITPLIPPIRAFRSSRRSVEMNATQSRRSSTDQDAQDETLRALEGYERVNPPRTSKREPEEQSSDDSDLFLKLAREEASTNNSSTRGPIRRSQIDRQSLPPSSSVFQSASSRRRGSDQESLSGSRPADEHGTMAQVLTYRPSAREKVAPLDDLNRNRYYGSANSRSTPTTPRTLGSRELSPESQAAYGGRRPSVPDSVLPSRTGSYRQSNLSYSTPRTYNSSPLISRTMDIHEAPETPRVAEGTESTVSTTAPSTVWDELEDLKSRIHRLELTGKLPATSGAAISRASNERPPTATTTVTTMSLSPKRGRGNSISPADSVEPPPADAHPLLHSALAKSKPLLSAEVYKALEITASDALAIAAMMGSSGQPGPISSSQSTVGPGPVSDRQVRRKADSMCRSLTELCLALSESKNEQAQATSNPTPVQSTIRDVQTNGSVDPNVTQRQTLGADLTRVKSSPRPFSRLEARRSSLLATSSLPGSRHTPSEAGTPTQSSLAGRRTSMLLRTRRAATEEPEDEDESRFRAPSRATTEIGKSRNPPREYVSQQPLPDSRVTSAQSSLPVRRHYISTSLTNTGAPPVSTLPNLGSRRYLDRSTPERETTTNSAAGRLANDQGQRKSSLGPGFPLGRTGSLTRRTRQSNGDSSTASQGGSRQ